ncbi:hypothetical protein [Hyphococcus sp.]|uniref:hypothetical protein n=1 Tax=Hyphococcus sp. TaxID=2038636 RepID=UPI003D0C9E14
MPDESRGLSNLLMIKSHLDSHGIGCAVMKDHIAIGAMRDDHSPGCPCEKITRVTSFREACGAIGCGCDKGR